MSLGSSDLSLAGKQVCPEGINWQELCADLSTVAYNRYVATLLLQHCRLGIVFGPAYGLLS